jgi:hypothetical protein
MVPHNWNFSASEHAGEFNPEVISTLREEYLRLLAHAESLGPVPRPKTIRRGIFEWFEQG